MSAEQLPLDLGFRPALNADDFLVAECNEMAVVWIDRWPDWPGPGLIVHGPSGSGKTHLIQVWAARSGADILSMAQLAAGASFQNRAVAIDDANAVSGDQALEQRLFHLYNDIASQGGKLLLTAPGPAAGWSVGLPDLASRLRSANSAEILEPDDTVLSAVLVKQFADRQLMPSAAVVRYLVARMERSFAAARTMVDRLDRASLSARRPITVALVRQVLAADGDQ
ncbi:MAG: hypothetical protein AAF414_03180 [Pseudomonadota bacterium]